MMKKSRSSIGSIAGIAVLVGSLVVSVRPSMSKPGDVLKSLTSPGVGAPAKEKRDIAVGDLSYASRAGALQYGYTFVVPPGRLGIQPSLELSYSSQGSLRGGVASGWSMGIPMIELDTSDNHILEMTSATGESGRDALINEDLAFVSSMSGGHRLVQAGSAESGWTAFRAEYDDRYIRYERHDIKGIWRARTMDGKIWYFGTGHDGEDDTKDSDNASADPELHDGIPASLIFDSTDTQTARLSPHHQPLTRVVDIFGNTVRYFWQADVAESSYDNTFPESLQLHSIRYTENFGANLGSHAKVDFFYDNAVYCSGAPQDKELPVGASLNQRGFFPWVSSRRALSHVETAARSTGNGGGNFSPVRRVKLEMFNACPASGGAARQLQSIALVDPDPVDANAAADLQNPITFNYGELERQFDKVTDLSMGGGTPTTNMYNALSWGHRRKFEVDATLERSLLDFDGDGRLDWLQTDLSKPCAFTWRKNRGDGSFEAPLSIDFPSEGTKWKDGGTEPGVGEGCSLSARRNVWTNVGFEQLPLSTPGNHVIHRFIDMNRDGRPDLVTSLQYTSCLIRHNVNEGYTAPGITEVFNEPWPANLSTEGVCTDVSTTDITDEIETLCHKDGGDDCGCAVIDQSAVDNVVREQVKCADFSEDVPGVVSDNTSAGGSIWNPDSNGCRSYPLVRNGHYPWKIYYSIDTTAGIGFDSGHRIWSPIPLDPATNDSGLANNGGRGISSANHAVLDLTGDGVMDIATIGSVVTPTTVNGEGGRHWNVFAGESDPTTGEFIGFKDEPFYWIIPKGAYPSASAGIIDQSQAPNYFSSLTSTSTMLLDTNADGLPDLIRRKPDTAQGFELALNTGRGFCVSKDGEIPNTVLGGEISIARTGYDNVFGTLPPIGQGGNNNTWIANSGEGKNFANLVDFDGDGLPDYYNAGDGNVILSPLGCSGPGCTTVTPGAGAGFQSTGGAMSHYIPRDIEVGYGSDDYYWWQISDYMDLDGDGLNDLVTPESLGDWDLTSEDTDPGKPLRLLNEIDNGQGLTTKVEYHPYRDDKAVSIAATDKGMPSHVWVVTKISTQSNIDSAYSPAPPSEVNIKYGDPAYTKNHRQRSGFRGFESIQTSRPHNEGATSGFSVSEQRYDYDIDWSGRLTDTVTYVNGFPIDSGAHVAAISSKEWTQYQLFLGTSISFHSASSSSRNCLDANGLFRSEANCTDAFSSGKKLSQIQPFLYASGSNYPIAWGAVSTESYLAVPGEEGSKRTESDLLLDSDDQSYRLHSPEKRSYVRESGQWVLSNKTTQELDSNNRYVRYSGQYGIIDGALVEWKSESIRNSAGVVVQSRDPEDFGTSASVATLYSAATVHPRQVTNELGQISGVSIDHGTGQVTSSTGSNFLTCTPFRVERTNTEYDKLGRPTSVSRRGCEGGVDGYTEMSSVQYIEYDATTLTPAHIIATTVLDSTAGETSVTTTYVDGAGRILRTEGDLGAGETAETIFHYDSAGQLIRHKESNPSTDPENNSDYTDTVYSYDSLGRATAMRQGTSAAIGVDLAYARSAGESIKTTTETVSDVGPAGETKTHSDHFGRLVLVREKMDDGTYAETTYSYDGNNNVATITDAADVITELFHDMAGRRTKVVRGEREWTYAYNKNGNMVRETSPNDLGETADNPGTGNYTTSTVYDVLDRPTSRLLAIDAQTLHQEKSYDALFVDFVYDSCPSGIGKLCSVQTGENLLTEYVFDWAGRTVEERQSISLREYVADFGDSNSAPDFTMSRSSYFVYNSANAVTEAWLPDGPDQASSTHLQYDYNSFTGAPEKLSQFMGVDKKGNPTLQEIAFVTRNRAQRVVSQTTGCLTRQWEYDHLGRVTKTEVLGSGCTVQNGPILSEGMEYFDSSEVQTHDIYRAGLTPRTFKYKYDTQHQLIEADDSISYQVSFGYSPDGNGMMDSVSGIDGVLLGRDPMTYSYGDGTLISSGTNLGADKHAPTTLSGLAKDLHYSYDFAGNVSLRTEITDPTGSPSQSDWSFGYDGSSQQREVLLNNGTDGRELYYYDNAGQRYMALTYASSTDAYPERIRIWMGGAEIWYTPNAAADAMEVSTEYAYLSLGALNIGRIKSEGPIIENEATFANGLSHVMGSVNWDSGSVNAAFVYGPYGEIVDSTGPDQDDHLRRFNGKESDQLSKLSYYGFRYYDEQSLSWTQADPKYLVAPDAAGAEPRRMGLYQFSLNNPVRYMDPDGLDPTLDPQISASELANNFAEYHNVKTAGDKIRWTKATIALYKINAAANGVSSYTFRDWDDAWAAMAPYGEYITTLLPASYSWAVSSIVHEVAHAEFNSMVPGGWNHRWGWRGLASELYAQAASGRALQAMAAAFGKWNGFGATIAQNLAGIAIQGTVSRARFSDEANALVDQLFANGNDIESIANTLDGLQKKEEIFKDSRSFESRVTGNSTFDFIWQNELVWTVD